MKPENESWRRMQQRRVALRQREDCRFVAPDEYRELLVSRLALDRRDDIVGSVRGLLDRKNHMLFLVEEECL